MTREPSEAAHGLGDIARTIVVCQLCLEPVEQGRPVRWIATAAVIVAPLCDGCWWYWTRKPAAGLAAALRATWEVRQVAAPPPSGLKSRRP